MNQKDYYEILGIKRTSTDKEIKSAYRRLAKKYHPDTNAGNKQAEQKFKEITEAYTVLSDPEKKRLYDQYKSADPMTGQYQHSGTGENDGSWQGFHFTSSDTDDIFEDFFGDVFHGGTAGHGTGRGWGGFQRREKGADAWSDISISFDEACLGCSKTIRLQNEEGITSNIRVTVPAGIQDGKSIRLKGKGLPGRRGGEPGDLLLRVHVETKKGWERKENDLYVTVCIPFEMAVLGGEVIVPTLTGNVACKIPAGTRCNTKIRLRGKGVANGDEYIVVQIEVPRHLSSEKLKKLKEYASA